MERAVKKPFLCLEGPIRVSLLGKPVTACQVLNTIWNQQGHIHSSAGLMLLHSLPNHSTIVLLLFADGSDAMQSLRISDSGSDQLQEVQTNLAGLALGSCVNQTWQPHPLQLLYVQIDDFWGQCYNVTRVTTFWHDQASCIAFLRPCAQLRYDCICRCQGPSSFLLCVFSEKRRFPPDRSRMSSNLNISLKRHLRMKELECSIRYSILEAGPFLGAVPHHLRGSRFGGGGFGYRKEHWKKGLTSRICAAAQMRLHRSCDTPGCLSGAARFDRPNGALQR